MLVILFTFSVLGASLKECQRSITAKDTPCIVATSYLPSQPCENYNYTIINQQNISIENSSFYSTVSSCQFIFDYNTKDIYFWNSSIESGIITIYQENNMIAIILVFIILIVYFTILGLTNSMSSMKFLCFGLGVIELIMMVAVIYVSEDAGDYISLLRINFYSILIIGFGLGMLTFFIKNAEVVTESDILPMENKWGNDKWH